MKVGSDIPGVRIEQGRYHSLEATDEMGVVFEAKAHRYEIGKTEEYLCVRYRMDINVDKNIRKYNEYIAKF